MKPAVKSAVSAADRFGFTLFFAAAVHALIVLGVGFTWQQVKPRTSIEVTLAQHPSEKAPDKADFIAQANQEASGTEQEKHLPSTRQNADFQDKKSQELAAQQTPNPTTAAKPNTETLPDSPVREKKHTSAQSSGQQKVVTATRSTVKADTVQASDAPSAPDAAPGTATSLLAKSLEIASLQAKIKRQQDLLARAPRIRTITSASTKQHSDAQYLENWRRKIETVGNLNYPEEARKRKMYGSLRLLVAIRPDGSVKEVDILKSSGFPVLDDAAVKIVRLAAPFQPFPVEMRKNTDILEIIRTWKFEKKAYID